MKKYLTGLGLNKILLTGVNALVAIVLVFLSFSADAHHLVKKWDIDGNGTLESNEIPPRSKKQDTF